MSDYLWWPGLVKERVRHDKSNHITMGVGVYRLLGQTHRLIKQEAGLLLEMIKCQILNSFSPDSPIYGLGMM